MEITKQIVEKLIATVSCGLSRGLGTQEPGKMCVEAAVCYALGMDHGDDPQCVGFAVRKYKIRLNDSNWSSNQARANGMIKLAIAQLGSDTLDQKEFVKKIVLKNINTIIADLAGKHLPEIEQDLRNVNDLNEAKNLCRRLKDAASAAADAANAAAYAAAAYASASADAAAAAADAAYAAADAAADAAYAAADAADAADARDKILNQAAQNCLDVLIEMKSPGCEFLYLLNN